MAYNGGFPMSYQPMYYPQYQQPQQPQQQNTNGIIWVQGEAGAKAYPVAPNCTVQLWDSEAQVVYLKSADASGMPTMKVLDYTIRDAKPTVNVTEKPQVDLSGYITRKEFEDRMKELVKADE